MIRIFVGALLCALPYTAQADEFNTKAFNVEIDCKNEIKFMEFRQDESFSWDNAYLLSLTVVKIKSKQYALCAAPI